MEKLILKGDHEFPTVILDSETGKFELSGKSIPQEADDFYKAVLSWLDAYVQKPLAQTHFRFNLEYFNISSSKMIIKILHKLCDLSRKGHKVAVSWLYWDEDEEMYEVGRDLANLVELPFEFKAVFHKELSPVLA